PCPMAVLVLLTRAAPTIIVATQLAKSGWPQIARSPLDTGIGAFQIVEVSIGFDQHETCKPPEPKGAHLEPVAHLALVRPVGLPVCVYISVVPAKTAPMQCIDKPSRARVDCEIRSPMDDNMLSMK